jgi:hypothetical protein
MNPVKITLMAVIGLIGLASTATLVKQIDNVFLGRNQFIEPTHLMTEAEMIQVCIEEGIPLD